MEVTTFRYWFLPFQHNNIKAGSADKDSMLTVGCSTSYCLLRGSGHLNTYTPLGMFNSNTLLRATVFVSMSKQCTPDTDLIINCALLLILICLLHIMLAPHSLCLKCVEVKTFTSFVAWHSCLLGFVLVLNHLKSEGRFHQFKSIWVTDIK